VEGGGETVLVTGALSGGTDDENASDRPCQVQHTLWIWPVVLQTDELCCNEMVLLQAAHMFSRDV